MARSFVFPLVIACSGFGCGSFFGSPPDDIDPGLPDAGVPGVDAGPRPDALPTPTVRCNDGTRSPGEICFGAPIMIDATGPVRSPRLVDVTADGKLDLVYLTPTRIVYHRGDGQGHFASGTNGPATVGYALGFGDLGGDGSTEIVVAGATTITAWRTGGAAWPVVGSLEDEAAIERFVVANFDGVAGDELGYASGGDFWLYRWSAGSFAWRARRTLDGPGVYSITATDADEDGRADALVANGVGYVLYGDPNGIREVAVVATGFPNMGDGTRSITALATGHVEAFDRNDFVMAQVDPGVIGTRSHAAAVDGAPRFLAIAQLDKAGPEEIVVGIPGLSRLQVLRAHPDQPPTEGPAVTFESAMTSLYADGDVDSDGIVDFVLGIDGAIVVLPSGRP